MLVLSRKVGEKICIGNNICITIVDIDRGRIRLGIDAPRDVPVHRQEICDAIFGRRSAEVSEDLPASPEELEAAARAAGLDVLSREVILFEEDGSTSLMTVS